MQAEHAQRTLESDARHALATALAAVPGPKGLLVDDTLYDPVLSVARPLQLFTDLAYLREHGIRAVAPLTGQGAGVITDILAQPAVVIMIRAVNAAAARAAVTAIRIIHEHDASRRQLLRNRENSSKAGLPLQDIVIQPTQCLILTTPRRSKIVEKILRMAGMSNIPIAPLPLGFLPFDGDLITLDWPEAYRQIVLEGDNSAILATATALSSLANSLNLEYTTIRTAGAAATAVAEELLQTHGQIYPRHLRDTGSESPSSLHSSINRSTWVPAFVAHDAFIQRHQREQEQEKPLDTAPTMAQFVGNVSKRHGVNLVIIDRGVDVVSPLLTQSTYEGLLDEAIGMRNNVMDLPMSSIVSDEARKLLSEGPHMSSNTGTVRKRLRGDIDPIFREVRDGNYWQAARKIGNVATAVKEYYKKRPTRETAEISQVRDYVERLKEVKSDHWSAAAHMAIAEEISARTFNSYDFKKRFELEREMMEGSTATARKVFIADAMAKGESLPHVLRLCCLWSVTSSGIDAEELDFMRKEIAAIFGLGVVPLLCNLERAGMLIHSVGKGSQNNLAWMPFTNLGASSTSGSVSGRGANSDSGSTTGSTSSFATVSENTRSMRTKRTEYSWQFARAALRLVTNFDPEKPAIAGTSGGLSAPYSGYTPLSVRLVEAGLSEEGWNSLPQIVAHTSLLPAGHATVEHRRAERRGGEILDAVVVFVGGVARAEVTATRLAAKQGGGKVLIATTAVMGADDFVMSLDDALVTKAPVRSAVRSVLF